MGMSNAKSVHWSNETAQSKDGASQQVTVVLWDYDAKEGKAMIPGGHFVDVYVTDYVKADLTIGQRPQEQS